MQSTNKFGLEPSISVPTGNNQLVDEAWMKWPARFKSKVSRSDGCWTWTACRDARGYGRYGTTRARGTQPAHRMALELSGTSAESMRDMHVDHLCRNTSCVRPDHLEIVTAKVNILRGRAANASGLCRTGRHQWINTNIVTEPNGTRRCRPCRDEREKQYRPAKGNRPSDRTNCPQGHPYDGDNLSVKPNGNRECKECNRIRARARYWKLKEAMAGAMHSDEQAVG